MAYDWYKDELNKRSTIPFTEVLAHRGELFMGTHTYNDVASDATVGFLITVAACCPHGRISVDCGGSGEYWLMNKVIG